ncbi:MAG: NAD(P)-dependent oxidoreductase [Fimbriimonadaceae bacterium]
MQRVGFVGLGVMGLPMAGHLLGSGTDLTVWNRTIEKARGIGRKGARIADSLSQMGLLCDLVAICVTGDEEVGAIIRELSRSARPGTLFIDHSTTSPTIAKTLAGELAQAGHRFIDGPVTGGSAGAEKGTLTVFCGGNVDDIEEAKPVLRAYARTVEHVGPHGSGQTMKIANQIAVAGALIGLCESLAFCERAGLDLEQAHRLIGSGAAGSWAFQNYGPKILDRDWSPGFSVRNQRKDLRYALAAAVELDASTPGTKLADELLSHLEEAGRSEESTAALFDVYVGSTG